MAAKRPVVSRSKRVAHAGIINWNHVLDVAIEIVTSYDTMVTLRQLYYRLISDESLNLPNKKSVYKHLSAKTAQARREGEFPALIDRTREIENFASWDGSHEALIERAQDYRRDRSEDQEWSIYLGVEKHGMTTQLLHWFGKYGIPVLALGGYSSQTFVDDVRRDVLRQERPALLLYAGDFDASGVDIDRDFIERADCFDKVTRVALNQRLIDKHDLPPMPGKESDSRSARFKLQHGELIQVELDALPPEELRKLYQKQIDKHWDVPRWEASMKQEARERKSALAFASVAADSTGLSDIIESIIDPKGKNEDSPLVADWDYTLHEWLTTYIVNSRFKKQ